MKISNQKLVSMTYSIHEGTNLLENVDTPVSFIYGKETNLLPIVENSLKGKEKGNELTIEVSPELGFGEIDENLIFVDSVDNVPKEYSKLECKLILKMTKA
jgi:FKBP-type peptidyl-prolyl cis-trans isomerase SlyD